MEDIKEIIYVPTLRCNYKCLHCGQNRFIKKEEEISSSYIIEAIENLNITNSEIFITGGEPFLKEDLEEFILEIVNNKKYNVRVSITTNGYFTEKIKSLIDKVNFKEKLSFSISIDGIGDMHNNIRGNSQAYKKAIDTVNMINELGIEVSVNTVIQKSNISQLEEIDNTLKDKFKNKVKHDFIPEMIDVSQNKEFQFNNDDVKKIFKYTDCKKDIKYLLSKGNFRLKNCHAGLKNFVISPTGKIYTCLTGMSYFSDSEENKYYMGDLKKDSINKILDQRENVYKKNIKSCHGCNNPCEIFREEKYFDFNYKIEKEDAELLFLNDNKLKYYLDFNWHPEEYINEQNSLQWMAKEESSIFINNANSKLRNIKISFYNGYINTDKPYQISFFIDDILYEKIFCKGENNQYSIKISSNAEAILKLTIKVEFLWDEGINQEGRKLGIALKNIELEYDAIENYIKIDEQEIREKIRTAINDTRISKNVNVQEIVASIRSELGDSEDIGYVNKIYDNNYSEEVKIQEERLTLWYKIFKKINLKLRKMPCYNKIFKPIVESIKRIVPKSAKYENGLNYKDLMQGNNAEFIKNAYLNILLRNPDEDGFENCNNILINSKGNRIFVLGSLRYSDEGRQKEVAIKGLYSRYLIKRSLKKMYKIPLIGYLIKLVIDIFTMSKKFDDIFTALISNQIQNERYSFEKDLMKQDILNINQDILNINEYILNVKNKIGESYEEINLLKDNYDNIVKKELEDKLIKQKEEAEFDEVYLKFEDKFRGDRSEIKERLERYIPILENLDEHNNHDSTNVIDVGCGRGEWLELLKEKRFIYTGVDMNQNMVEFCNGLNLNVVKDDAISYLSKLEDSSVYVITGFQILEHIGGDNIIKLLKESYRVLKSGGMAIFETPNPENIIIGACNFYLDLTHSKPIPPTQLQFLAESCGFDRVDILRLHPYNAIDVTNVESIEIGEIANFFNGTTDYSILAYKE
jgi:O-antigen chain-terminating methyltransferase